jgi:antitoxin ParD1/3/4
VATRNISLTEPLDRFIDERVESGDFQNASEVVRAGLRLLRRQTEEDSQKLERLRALVQEGVNDIEAGRYVELAWDELDAWLDRVGRRSER